jgi:RND family efflux transporter MFP subunit
MDMKKLSVPKMVSALWSNKKLRYISLAVTALAVAGTAMTLSSGKNVTVTPVTPQLLEDSFWEDGVVRAQTRSVVSADLSGKVISVRVREGQAVKSGDILLVLDTGDLQAERKRISADRAAIMASWEQTRDQVKQQIAGIEAQRAAYGTADTNRALGEQIELLDWSLDPGAKNSVAWLYENMLDTTDAQYSYVNSRLKEASGLTSAEVQALESQLEAAQIQRETIALQQAQSEAQREQQKSELESKKADAVTAGDTEEADEQVARLEEDLDNARDATPQAVETRETQLLALENEHSALKEQYNLYILNTQTQILSLMAQQEQAAAAVSSEKKVKNALGVQIDLLKQSMQNDSSTASYYEAQIEKIDASLEDLDRKIALATVTAPNDGIVGALDITQGQYLQAGTTITEVVDPSSLRVECMLLTDDANSVSKETPARIVWERRDGDIAYTGDVQTISSLAVNSISAIGLNEQRVKTILTPAFDGADHPGDGYQVRIAFTTASQTALAVPQSAVIQTDAGDAVYVVKEKKAVLAPVTLGMESEDMVAVLGGLAEGDIVIRNPETDGINEGDTVAVKSVVQ